jgi:hypothetical protein
MFRIVVATLVLALCAAGGSAAPRARQVFKGTIQDVRGIYGTLTLRLAESTPVRQRTFRIHEARIVGLPGAEWKVGDLREGDRVEVEMAADGRTVQEVRVVEYKRVGFR